MNQIRPQSQRNLTWGDFLSAKTSAWVFKNVLVFTDKLDQHWNLSLLENKVQMGQHTKTAYIHMI